MNDQLIPFNAVEFTFIGIYLLSLIGIGYAGFRARQEDTLRDFYLGGKGAGVIVLLLTLYATQYSGNTLFGFSGKTYRDGYSWGVSIHFMTAIVIVYLSFAPKLYRLSRKYDFVTPTDFLSHRFSSPALSLFATMLMVIALANFTLAQLIAMGRALEGFNPLNPDVAYICGVVVLALIIVIYETLGGFRAVAWTDVIQGSVLLVSFGLLVCLMFVEFGSLSEATRLVAKQNPSLTEPPTGESIRRWFSYIVIVGVGAALYPQAIQRIYCARDSKALRRSLTFMAFLPLTTALVALIVGIMGRAHFPGLYEAGIDQSDTILTVIFRHIQGSSLLGRWLVVVLFAGILAAIMSTADSMLLSISSMVTKDVYRQHIQPEASEAQLTQLGKVFSWVLIILLTLLAILLRETNLVTLLDRKLDLLIQLAPAFLIGTHWKRLLAGPTFLGIVAGVVIAIGLAIGSAWDLPPTLFGFHPGLYGLVVNLVIAVGGSLLIEPNADSQRYESPN